MKTCIVFTPFSESYFLKSYREDTPMDLNQAKKAISRAWILSAAGTAVEIWFEWNPLWELLEESPLFQKAIIKTIIYGLQKKQNCCHFTFLFFIFS